MASRTVGVGVMVVEQLELRRKSARSRLVEGSACNCLVRTP